MWSLLKIDNATTARQFDDITLYCQAVVLADGEFYRDDLKAAQNPAKHGVSFDVAKTVFKDPFAIEQPDDREDYGETRLTIINIVDSHHVCVAYILRNELIRTNSARAAESSEKARIL